MDQENTPTVGVDTDGNVLKCAKGAGMGECGYKAGSAICGKCGAMAVRMKMVPDMPEEDEMSEEMPEEDEMAEEVSDEETEEMPDEEDEMEEAVKSKKKDKPSESSQKSEKGMMGYGGMHGGKMPKKKKKMYGKPSDPDMEDMEDMEKADDMEMEEEEAMDMPMAASSPRRPSRRLPERTQDEDEMDEEDLDDTGLDEDEMAAERKMRDLRKRRMMSMGVKIADIGEDVYMCAIERKILPLSSATCSMCMGGCPSEKGMPGLLEAEAVAEGTIKGKIFDSGYSSDKKFFVVHMETKSGENVELIINGENAKVERWRTIESLENVDSKDIISFSDAAEIVSKVFDGSIMAIEPDVFEGKDAYVVETEDGNGSQYDFYVGLDGELLGFDKYVGPDETEDIEAEAAEIALKRAFSEERRAELAEEGMALSDGSYPIVSEGDLRNAIQAFGRAKDKEKAKAHIKKRAKEMGREDLLPENWTSSEKSSVEDEIVDPDFLKSLAEFQMLEAEIDKI